MRTIATLAGRLDAGDSSHALVEQCLDRIKAPDGEGSRAFLKVYGEEARAAAEGYDRMRRKGAVPSPYAGIPVSIKDLFDVAGDVTAAGSVALAGAPPAPRDAVAVARLRAAGFIPIGRTNMTEFAFSGLGLNPHFDTPRNPWDRRTGRIPGGSSSGAAVSVTDGMAVAALGTDTGGSCRIPAALTGIAGFKPTQKRIPVSGAFPLSQTLDSVGPLAPTVACCAVLDAVLAGEQPAPLPDFPLDGLRIGVPQTLVLDHVDKEVGRAFAAALTALSGAGAKVTDVPLKELSELNTINAKGGFAAAESWAIHRGLLKVKGDLYDPRVKSRIERGREQEAADYLDLLWAREEFILRMNAVTLPFDVLAMPTVPQVAPAIAPLIADDEAYRVANLLMLRNPAVVNFIDRCAISIPCHRAGEAPVGLMLVGETGDDRRLLAIAAAVERLVSPRLPD